MLHHDIALAVAHAACPYPGSGTPGGFHAARLHRLGDGVDGTHAPPEFPGAGLDQG